MSLEKQIARRNKGLKTVKSTTAAILIGSVAATGAVTAGLAGASIAGTEQDQGQDTTTDVAMPQPPVNAPKVASANSADMNVVQAKAKAAKKAAKQAAAQAAADAAAAAQQASQQQQQQSAAKSHGS